MYAADLQFLETGKPKKSAFVALTMKRVKNDYNASQEFTKYTTVGVY